MSSKSNASDPCDPLISSRIAFLRPHANRVASNVASPPPDIRPRKIAASSTVTGPVSVPDAVPCSPPNDVGDRALLARRSPARPRRP